MNKKANRKAFFVCMFICLMYVSVAVKLPEKMSFKRVSDNEKIGPANMNISMQANRRHVTPETASGPATQKILPAIYKNAAQSVPNDDDIKPSLFISVPLVCFAIKEGLLEKEGLISVGQGNHNTVNWKKPIDILHDKDEEGLKNISKTIGIKRTLDFLKHEGVTLKEGLSAEEIMLGRDYVIEKKKLLLLYNNFVSDDYKHLLPFTLDGKGIDRRNGTFEFVTVKTQVKSQYTEENTEWQMPNLLNLPIKVALEKLAAHTTRIKIHGSGIVNEQSPKPFERITGKTECIIYGRTQK